MSVFKPGTSRVEKALVVVSIAIFIGSMTSIFFAHNIFLNNQINLTLSVVGFVLGAALAAVLLHRQKTSPSFKAMLGLPFFVFFLGASNTTLLIPYLHTRIFGKPVELDLVLEKHHSRKSCNYVRPTNTGSFMSKFCIDTATYNSLQNDPFHAHAKVLSTNYGFSIVEFNADNR